MDLQLAKLIVKTLDEFLNQSVIHVVNEFYYPAKRDILLVILIMRLLCCYKNKVNHFVTNVTI